MLAIKRGYSVLSVLVILSMVFNPLEPLFTVFAKDDIPQVEPEQSGYDLAYELSMGSPSPILESAPNFGEEYAKTIAAQDEEPELAPQIHMTVDPVLVIPGEPISISWEVSGLDELKSKVSLDGVHLAFEGSDAVQLAAGQKMPEGAKASTLGFNMAANSDKGQMTWTLNASKAKKNEPNYLAIRLMDGDEEITSQAVYLAEPSFTVDAKSGGKIAASDGRMSLEIPASAISEGLYMDIRQPSPHTAPYYSKTGHSIEVVAVGQTSKKNVNKFSDDITVHMTYDDEALKRWSPQDMSIFYYDQATNDWYPLETTVDEKTRTLTAKVNHLTVFDYSANTWQASRLPSLDEFQVADFTGAGTYSVDFWTPSAPGGFQPTLSLNYSSQTIDDSVLFTQASWVGMGWSLDTGSIERNMHGSTDTTNDDTFQLSVGGISSMLLPISTSGTVTTYVTSEQSYWTITYDSSTDTWDVWDQNGTHYDFDARARTSSSSGCSTAANLNLTWRWSLSTATDKFGNAVTYTYYNQVKSASCYNVLAVYPATITWPNGRYRVNFVREARTDYQTAWESTSAKINYSTSRLDKIQVQHSADGSTWSNIRLYDFTYSAGTANQIYPSFTWTKGQRTTTLIAIQELSGDGGSTLPATTFTYTDAMHLTVVNNGQGGQVTLAYERWTYLDDDNDELRSLYTMFGDIKYECAPSYTTWSVYNNYGSVKCEANMLQLDQRSYPIAIARHEFPEFIIKPGGQYRMAIYARSIYGTSGLEYGFRDMVRGIDYENSCTLTTTRIDCESGKEMPSNFNPTGSILLLESPQAYIQRLQFMIMPLYFRVTSRVVTESTTGQTATYTYTYDGPSSNDEHVSAVVAANFGDKTKLYVPSRREYRGNAITRVKDPDGLVNTTWFYQSDNLKGRAYRNLLAKEQVYEPFSGDTPPTGWTYSSTTYQTMVATLNGVALKSVNTSANWNIVVRKTDYSITDGDVIYAQFLTEGGSAQVETGIENSSGDFFGVVSSAANGVKLRTIIGGNTTDSDTLISSANFSLSKMYMLMIFMDADDGFHVRVWEVNNPSKYGESSSTSLSGAVSYRLRQRVYNGTGCLDTYQEGTPISEATTAYTTQTLYDTTAGNGIPDIANASLVSVYEDLAVRWSYATEQISRSFNGDYSFVGTKTTYDYNTADQGGTQYGNLTRATSYSWNGSAWTAYRGSKTQYVPNATAHLTALPARQVSLDCFSGACDFSGESGLTSEALYLYDNSAVYSAAPSAGKLTAQRVLVEGSNYAQTGYAYDAYGNRTQTINYVNYAGVNADPTGDTRTYSTTYDTTYHTYAISESNPAGHTLQTTYDYTLSAPITVTDANGNVTGATYDVFGRMTKVIAPGDTTQSPTLQVAYYDTRTPWQVDLTQKVDAGASIRISHFYDGLGRKLQTQQVGKVVNGTQMNVVTDTRFDNMGRQTRQTVPYTITYNASPVFNTQTFSQTYTQYTYDDFGRLASTVAANGNTVTQSYGDNYTTVTDAKSVSTTSYVDSWGRTTRVDAATGPDMLYAYDTLDRLVQVSEGDYVGAPQTGITYNAGGQKRSMSTPDLGTWTYTYDALGNLYTQADARGCTTTMSYDNINRLTGKTYSGSGACGSTPAATYTYDSGTNGLGHRTAMSDGSGSTSYTYDARGRLLSQTKVIDTESFTSSWTYNSADNPVTMTYPDGEVLTYDYDSQGNLQSIVNGESFTYLENMLYDEAGRITEMDLGANILEKSFSYYAWTTTTVGGSLANMTAGQVGGSTLQDIDYTYDANGNVTEIANDTSGETSTYSYDTLNRLTAAVVNDGLADVYTEAFGYDSTTGNLQYKGETTNTWLLYEYSAGQPHAVTHVGDSQNQRYWYDENGNMTRRFEADNEERLLTYDGENRLISVLPASQPTATPTATETQTETSTLTETVTETPTPTETLEETATDTLEASEVPSNTPEVSETPSDTPDITDTPSDTPEVTDTPSDTPEVTDTPTDTPEVTNTPTETLTETTVVASTDTETPTATMTPTPTMTETTVVASTDTETPTMTPTSTLTATVSGTDTDTPTPTATDTETATPTDTETPTATLTETVAGTPTEEPPAPFTGAYYTYDGDDNLVMSVVNGITTYYAASSYVVEVDGETTTVKKTYMAGSTSIAVRTIVGEEDTLNWVLGDHLGSASVTTTDDGTWFSELRYSAFGETRYSSGVTPTDYRYTGQLQQADVNLYYYNARWYDAELGRFIQADTIVPGAGNSKSYDRFTYVNNNPVRYTDPSGHCYADSGAWIPDGQGGACSFRTSTPVQTKTVTPKSNVKTPAPIIPHDQHLPSEVPAALLSNGGVDENGNPAYDWGSNACGAVSGCAAAEALGVMGYQECMNRFAAIVTAGNSGYYPGSGVQPSNLAAIMTEVLKGVANVDVVQAPSPEEGFSTIANALDQGSQVIVDYMSDNAVSNGMPVNKQSKTTYAHFARVYDISSTNITLVNSLNTDQLEVSAERSLFSQAWDNPERMANWGVEHPSEAEPIKNWMMIISKP